jgi:hypothetical protein
MHIPFDLIPMFALIPALFSSGAIGGSSAKRDRAEELNAYGDLRNVFNWALPEGKKLASTGQGTFSAGIGDLGTAAGYFKKLASGSRPDMMQAIAPEVASVTSANDAAKRQLATSGTARGGGTAAVNETRDAATQAKIDEALFGVRPQAAGELAKVGSVEGELGLGETGEGLKAANLAGQSAYDLGALASHNRMESTKIHQQAVDDITKGIDETLSAVMGAL